MNLKENIKSYFKKKRLNVFITFLILSLLFSVLTKLSGSYTKTIPFRLNLINIPEEITIINDSLHEVEIIITTFGFKLFKYYFNKPEINIDFLDLEPIKSNFIWVEEKERYNIVSQFSSKETIDIISPDTITFSYSKNAIKVVPVVLNRNINFSLGYNLSENLKVIPDSIKIIGPKIIIDTINNIKTKSIVLENVNRDISESVQLKLPQLNPEVRFSNSEVNITGRVERFTEGSLQVPINMINVPENIRVNYYPKIVSVVFSTSLNDYKLINPSSFVIECDFKESLNNNSYLTPKFKRIPDNVKSARLDVKRVEFILIQE